MKSDKDVDKKIQEVSNADLKIKIGTPDEVVWEQVKKDTLAAIDSMKKNLMVNEAILKLAEEKIAAEQAK